MPRQSYKWLGREFDRSASRTWILNWTALAPGSRDLPLAAVGTVRAIEEHDKVAVLRRKEVSLFVADVEWRSDTVERKHLEFPPHRYRGWHVAHRLVTGLKLELAGDA